MVDACWWLFSEAPLPVALLNYPPPGFLDGPAIEQPCHRAHAPGSRHHQPGPPSAQWHGAQRGVKETHLHIGLLSYSSDWSELNSSLDIFRCKSYNRVILRIPNYQLLLLNTCSPCTGVSRQRAECGASESCTVPRLAGTVAAVLTAP